MRYINLPTQRDFPKVTPPINYSAFKIPLGIVYSALAALSFLTFTPTQAEADHKHPQYQNYPQYNNYPRANPYWHSNLHKRGGSQGFFGRQPRYSQGKVHIYQKHYSKRHYRNKTYYRTRDGRYYTYQRHQDIFGNSYYVAPRQQPRSQYQYYYQGKNFIILIK